MELSVSILSEDWAGINVTKTVVPERDFDDLNDHSLFDLIEQDFKETKIEKEINFFPEKENVIPNLKEISKKTKKSKN